MLRGLCAVVVQFAVALPVIAGDLVTLVEDELVELLRDKPDAFYEAATEVIIGYGSGGRVNAQDIERMVALRRASLRAGNMRRLLVADLDNDGSVTRAEVGAVLPTLSASVRARLVHAHRKADADTDGLVTPPELRQVAQEQALKTAPDRSFLKYRYVMLADVNRDGWVTLEEVHEVITRIAPKS